jgi:hypothetical protein
MRRDPGCRQTAEEAGSDMQDTWYNRELPVLRAAVAAFERDLGRLLPEVSDLAEATGLAADDVARAVAALHPEYLDLQTTPGEPTSWFVQRVHTSARRAVGQWPSPDTLAAQLAAAMQQVAEHTSDPDAKSRLRRAAEAIGGLAKDVLTEVGTKMLEHQIGLN